MDWFSKQYYDSNVYKTWDVIGFHSTQEIKNPLCIFLGYNIQSPTKSSVPSIPKLLGREGLEIYRPFSTQLSLDSPSSSSKVAQLVLNVIDVDDDKGKDVANQSDRKRIFYLIFLTKCYIEGIVVF